MMFKNSNYIEVDDKLTLVNGKIGTISEYISKYKEINSFQKEELLIPVNIVDSGESLFDGAFQKIICSLNTNIISAEDESTFKLILENTSDAVIVIDKNNRILSINPACSDIFEYKEEELIDKSLNTIIAKSYQKEFEDRSSEHIDSCAEPHKIMEEDIHVFRGKTKYGDIRTFESFFTTITIVSGEMILMVIRDLTYNQSLIDELLESKNNYTALSDTISEAIIRIDVVIAGQS